jgi:hypothetical protein
MLTTLSLCTHMLLYFIYNMEVKNIFQFEFLPNHAKKSMNAVDQLNAYPPDSDVCW